MAAKTISFKLFGGRRIFLAYEKDGANHVRGLNFGSHLQADIIRNGIIIEKCDLGSGLVTNVGVTAMSNDWNWASPSGAAVNTLKLSNWHSSGTGTTAAAATDIALQTAITGLGTSVVSGTQSFVTAANLQKYQTVATINYNTGGPYAVTEWALFTAQTLSATTGTPFTAGTATTGTVTGTPYTASSTTVQGEQQLIFQDTTAATPFYGVCVSNTSSVVTVPAWYTVSGGTLSGVNPVNADAFTIRPVMWDHKVFTAVNVNNGDTIQFTYTLQISSGG